MIIKQSYIKELIIYFIIGTISFLTDVYTGTKINKLYNKCKKPIYTLLLLYIHHLYASFIYFGWLSKHKIILSFHILSILFVMIFQYNNNMICPSTEIVNINCNINRTSYLRDFLYFTNIKDNNLYEIYIFVSFYISCYKIYNM